MTLLRCFIFFLLCSQPLLNLQAQPVRCSQAVSIVQSKALKPGETYKVQFAHDPAIYTLRFHRLVKENGEQFLEFKEELFEDKVIYRVHKNEVIHWEKFEIDGSLLLAHAIANPLSKLDVARAVSKINFKPFRLLAQNEQAVEVVGNLTGSKKMGQKIANDLQAFDQLMLDMGFKRPQLTRAVVGESLLPGFSGPFSISYPTLNIWSGKGYTPVLAMNQMGWNKKTITDEGTLFHERTHSILHATYSRDSYINKNETVQEALADFGAAHMLDSPKISMGMEKNNAPLRNIETRISQVSGAQMSRNSLFNLNAYSYHEDSMFISHILWSLRKSIGSEAMTIHLKSIVDYLNLYRESYEQILKTQGRISTDKIQNSIYDIEYVLSVLLKISKDWESSQLARNIIKEKGEELNFSFERIEQISLKLTSSNKDYSYKSEGKIKEALRVHLYGLTGLVVNGLFVLWISGMF